MQGNGGFTCMFGRGGFLVLAAVLVALFFWTCGDDSSTNNPEDPPANNGSIGPAGGTFTDAASGVTVEVPAGALSTATTLTCTHYADQSEVPDSMWSGVFGALGIVCLGPDGQTFDSAVTITVPVTETLTPGEQFPLFVWNTDSDS